MSSRSRSPIPAARTPRGSRCTARTRSRTAPAGRATSAALEAGTGARPWAAAARSVPTTRPGRSTAAARPSSRPTIVPSVHSGRTSTLDHSVRISQCAVRRGHRDTHTDPAGRWEGLRRPPYPRFLSAFAAHPTDEVSAEGVGCQYLATRLSWVYLRVVPRSLARFERSLKQV
jgi:hypothetical protein